MLLCVALSGCELVADFDRSRIPESDAGKVDAPSENIPEDAGKPPIEDSAVPNEDDADGG